MNRRRVGLGLLLAAALVAGLVSAQEGTTTQEPKIAADAALPRWGASGSVGYTMTTGNSRTSTITGGLEFKREGLWTNHFLKGGITYADVTYPGGKPIATANNYGGAYRFEGYLHESKKPYLWISPAASSDRFQGYWQRYTLDAGPGYSFFGKEKYVLKLEAGYLFSDTEWINAKEIEEDEFHHWEPTHNGLVRLIASVPIQEYLLFTEEALAYMNLEDEKDYRVQSTSALTVKLWSRLSFQSAFKVLYTNQPAYVDKLDQKGQAVTDDQGNKVPPVLAEHTDTQWLNSLVISFF